MKNILTVLLLLSIPVVWSAEYVAEASSTSSIEKKLQEFTSMVNEAENARFEAEKKVALMEEDIRGMRKAHEHIRLTLEETLLRAEEENKQLSREVAAARKDKERVDADVRQLQQLVEQNETRISELEHEVLEKKELLSSQAQQLKQGVSGFEVVADTGLEAKNALLASQVEELRQLLIENLEAIAGVDVLKEECAALKAAGVEKDERIARLTRDFQDLSEQPHRPSRQDSQSCEPTSLADELRCSVAPNAAFDAKNADLQGSISLLESCLGVTQSQKDAAEKINAQLQTEVARIAVLKDSLAREKAELQEQIMQLQAQLGSSQGEVETLRRGMESKDQTFQKEKMALDKKIQELTGQVEKLTSESSHQSSIIKNNSDKDVEIRALRSSLEQAEILRKMFKSGATDSQQLQVEVYSLRNEVSVLKSQLEIEKKLKKHWEEQFAIERQVKIRFQDESSENSTKVMMMETNHEIIKKQLERDRKRLEQSVPIEKFNKLLEEKNEIEDHLFKVKSALNSCNTKIDLLKSDLKRTEEKLYSNYPYVGNLTEREQNIVPLERLRRRMIDIVGRLGFTERAAGLTERISKRNVELLAQKHATQAERDAACKVGGSSLCAHTLNVLAAVGTTKQQDPSISAVAGMIKGVGAMMETAAQKQYRERLEAFDLQLADLEDQVNIGTITKGLLETAQEMHAQELDLARKR